MPKVMVKPRPKRNKLWKKRYDRFVKSGFSRGEAIWAANHKVALSNPAVKNAMRVRRKSIEVWLRIYPTRTRKEAVRQLSKELFDKNRRFGLSKEDLKNIFREASN